MAPESILTIVSILGNVIVGLAVYGVRSTIRVAILELKDALGEKYATKDELTSTEDRLNEKIDLRGGLREIAQFVKERK